MPINTASKKESDLIQNALQTLQQQIAEQLTHQMQFQHITKKQLVHESNVPLTIVNDYLNQSGIPHFPQLNAVCQTLNIDPKQVDPRQNIQKSDLINKFDQIPTERQHAVLQYLNDQWMLTQMDQAKQERKS